MPVPRLVANINKRVLNKAVLNRGTWPVLTHVGRSSGKTYQTPLEAYPTADGFLFVLMYGSEADWVKNTLAAGTAVLRIGDDSFDLVSPRLVTKEVAWQQLPAGTKTPPRLFRVTECLQMERP